jgi:hypothetical protein
VPFWLRGGSGVDDAAEDKELIAWLQRSAQRARRFGSICRGIPSCFDRTAERQMRYNALEVGGGNWRSASVRQWSTLIQFIYVKNDVDDPSVDPGKVHTFANPGAANIPTKYPSRLRGGMGRDWPLRRRLRDSLKSLETDLIDTFGFTGRKVRNGGEEIERLYEDARGLIICCWCSFQEPVTRIASACSPAVGGKPSPQ